MNNSVKWFSRVSKWLDKIVDKGAVPGSRRARLTSRTFTVGGRYLVRADGFRAAVAKVPDDMVALPGDPFGFANDPEPVRSILNVLWNPGMAETATNKIALLDAKFLREAIAPDAKSVYISGHNVHEPVMVACLDDGHHMVSVTMIMPMNYDRKSGGKMVGDFLTDLHATQADDEGYERLRAEREAEFVAATQVSEAVGV